MWLLNSRTVSDTDAWPCFTLHQSGHSLESGVNEVMEIVPCRIEDAPHGTIFVRSSARQHLPDHK